MGRNPYNPFEFLGVYSNKLSAESALRAYKDFAKSEDNIPFNFYEIFEKEIDSPIY